MRTRVWALALAALLLIPASVLRSQRPDAKAVDFANEIQPILTKSCQSCHSGGAPPADLRLESAAGLMQGSVSGKVVVPGDSAASLLYQRIIGQNGLRMPPSGQPLSSDEIALVQSWINRGAKIPESTDLFTTSVQPILAASCYACHSGNEPKGGLNLQAKALALKGGVSGVAIVPGNAKDSLLMHRVRGDNGKPQMPMGGKPLTTEQMATLARWIDGGAKWPDTLITGSTAAPQHWAYVKPVRPAFPAVKDAKWVRNAIDHFVLARLEKEGIKPSAEATKETLIRRVSLDLTGIPPTPAEVDAFLQDTRPDAYEKLVDRLLASPRYGERWATPWLDLARYGDSEGWTNDRQRVAWPYRDWVIRALNANMPFSQFTIEQLAGDMLPDATNDQKIATGFLRNSMLQSEGGTDAEENNWNAQIDRTSTVGTTWLGSTIACAQCHNHKYDPFTQKQFYQMVAFFNNSKFTGEPGDPRLVAAGVHIDFVEPRLDLPTPEQAKKRDEINAELQKYEKQINDDSPEFFKRQAAWEQNILDFEKKWEALRPTRVTASNGTTVVTQADGSVLASGKNPFSETYVLEGKTPLREITGIRLEALPEASLPGGGPGRDYYGNFMLQDMTVEIGAPGQPLTKVAVKKFYTDDSAPTIDVPQDKVQQLWIVDATRQAGQQGADHRARIQLLLVPEKPLTLSADAILKVTLAQQSEIAPVNLGHFRIGVTSDSNPRFALDVQAGLRSVLSIPAEKRSKKEASDLTARYRLMATELAEARQKSAELRTKIEDLNIPRALILAEDTSVPHPSAYVHARGAFASKAELVLSDVPSFLGPLPKELPPNRLGLAKWLVNGENPLTARVAVNHFWETIFGRGIVETAEDFGRQGFLPSHPELLDWLAVEFVEKGWDMKAIKRLIVTSNTYRQSSTVTPALLERDPDNALLTRGPRFRVESEMVRDLAMAASGQLSAKMFGPPVMPYQPAGLWDGFPGLKLGPDEWSLSPGEDRYRRGIYTFVRRTVRYPSLTVFDAPSREFCTARRPRSDTPLQALTTMNDPAFFEAAQSMGRRVMSEGGSDTTSRAIYAFRLVTSRKPTPSETDSLLSGFAKSRQRFEGNLKEAEKVAGKPDAELAAWTLFSNALLNLDEALTKE